MTKIERFRKSGKITRIINRRLVDLPTPINITMWWNFGSLLGLVLSIQILTGLFLAMHYTADINLAFSSVIHIVRDVNGGWFLRTLHSNGASFFFICLYAHVGRGLYYGRYAYKGLWASGVLLLLLVMGSAFLGYVLPWGQIRFWGATVITNLLSAVPLCGDTLVSWLWGGFSVGNATLTRFFAFHFLSPLLVAVVVFLHLCLLHASGRNNPLGVNSSTDKIPFHWYFTIKDLMGFVVLLSALLLLVFFYPNYLGEPDNFIDANPMSTPAHIVPEWYFLFAYAILRTVPNKLGGVVGLVSSLLFLLVLPFMERYAYKGNTFYPLRKALHWSFFLSFLMLTVGGAWPVEEPFTSTARLSSIFYFSFFLFHLPLRKLNDHLVLTYVRDFRRYIPRRTSRDTTCIGSFWWRSQLGLRRSTKLFLLLSSWAPIVLPLLLIRINNL